MTLCIGKVKCTCKLEAQSNSYESQGLFPLVGGKFKQHAGE
jgi:hypothetical protein